MAKIKCGDISFELSFSNAEQRQLNFAGKPNTAIAFQAFLLNESGPTMVFGTQISTSDSGLFEFSDVGRWRDGIYVSQVKTNNESENQEKHEAIFKVSNGCSDIASEVEVREALSAQEAFRSYEYREADYTGDNRFKIYVLLDKCFLDYEQFFRGGVLRPIKETLTPESVISAVNKILPNGVSFNNTENLDRAYGREHPLCLVSFQNVCADGLSQAVATIYRPLLRIIAALGQDRGATPQILAYIKEADEHSFEMSTPSDIYRGNLVHGFGPGVTSFLDQVSDSGEREPWLDFLLNLMTSVRQQSNPEVMLFLGWALIESAAKRRILKGNEVVCDDNGVALTSRGKNLTTAHDLGRVIVYLRDHVGPGILGLHAGNDKDFYAQVKLAYQCRNAIAHEGGIFRPGSAAPEGYTNAFPSEVRDWASTVVSYECMLPAI